MTHISVSAHGRTGSLRYLVAVVLFGLSTGLALAEESNLAVHKSMLQVQSGSYAASINHSGQESFRGR